PNTAASFLAAWQGYKLGKVLTRIWRMAIIAIWWAVWKERNDRCFNDAQSIAKEVGSCAKKLMFEWVFNVMGLKDYDLAFLGA
ncbi:hypothetical protein PJP10_32245, partial [Mycobacterium kansasii]